MRRARILAASAFTAASIAFAVPAIQAQEPSGPFSSEDQPIAYELEEPEVSEWSAQTRVYDTDVEGLQVEQIYAGTVNYRDGDRWAPIDTNLESGGPLGYVQAANSPTISISDNAGDGDLVSLALPDGAALSFGLIDAASAPGQVDGSEVTYEHVSPGTDVVIESLPAGVKETVVLHGPESPSSFAFDLTVTGLHPDIIDRQVVFYDAAGEPRLVLPPPFAQDAAEPVPAETSEVTYGLSDNGRVLTVTIDDEWLSSADRAWPVLLDPSVLLYTANSDTYVNENTPADNSSALTLNVGKGASGYRNRGFLRFNVSSLVGMNIHQAELNLWQSESYGTCSGQPTDVYAIEEAYPWSSDTSWPGPSYAPDIQAGTLLSGAGYSGSCTAGIVTADVSPIVELWVNRGLENYGLALVARDESSTSGYKKYASAQTYTIPSLNVVYTDPSTSGHPTTPTSLAPSGTVTTSTPTLTAQYSDPQGDQGKVVFRVYAQESGALLGTSTSATVNSGSQASATVSALTRDEPVFWRATARDVAGTKYSLSSAEVPLIYPSIYLTSPVEGSSVSSSTTYSASLATGVSATSVQFMVDDVVVASDSTSPYSATGIDMSGSDNYGWHDVQARIVGGGEDGTDSPIVSVDNGSIDYTGEVVDPDEAIAESGSFDNMMPTSEVSDCEVPGFLATPTPCQTDDSGVTAFLHNLTGEPQIRGAVKYAILNMWNPNTDLYVRRVHNVDDSGENETDWVFFLSYLPGDNVGMFVCNDNSPPGNSKCDQGYIHFDSPVLCDELNYCDGSSTGTHALRHYVCHESGHGVGLTHPDDSDPDQSNSNQGVGCMSETKIIDWGQRLGAHNVGIVNSTYLRYRPGTPYQ